MSARLWVGLCAVLLAAPAVAASRGRTLLTTAIASDALARATLTQRLGDETVLEALAQHEDSLARLAAVRCAPYLRDPTRALALLADLAAGRDPELAPAAARSLRTIAQAFALPDGALPEPEDDLAASARALQVLASSSSASREVRLQAGQAAFLLERAR